MAYGSESRFKAHIKKAEAKRRAMKKTTMTATDTGAKLAAIKRFAKNPVISDVAKRSEKDSVPKGVNPQYRGTSTDDIEKMIRGGN